MNMINMASANNRNFNKFEFLVISLMYKTNRRGPNILPCGKPQVKVPISELSFPILTHCLRSLR